MCGFFFCFSYWLLYLGEREMFYLTTHSTHFIYGYMTSDIWLRTILIVRKETRCRHIGYSYLLTARVLLYAPSHRQDNTYHGLCYTSRGALAGTRNIFRGVLESMRVEENKLIKASKLMVVVVVFCFCLFVVDVVCLFCFVFSFQSSSSSSYLLS